MIYDFTPDIPGASCQIKTLPDIYLQHFGYRTSGTFVEVGAFDGCRWSNVAPLAKLGWRGLCIEPNPEPFYALLHYHQHHDVACENYACGETAGHAPLYLCGSISTLVAETVELYKTIPSLNVGITSDTVVVNVIPLSDLLVKHDWPNEYDVLSIDVEGAELSVLKGAGLATFKPRLVIVETHENFLDARLSAKAAPIGDYLASFGYQKIYADVINSIYWLEE